jgi:aminomethyltransferase
VFGWRRPLLLVVNAANTNQDLAWIAGQAGADASWTIAAPPPRCWLQGRARHALGTLTGIDLASMRPFTVRRQEGVGLVSRTGYTGEDGFEVLVPADSARTVWDALVAAARCGGRPAAWRTRHAAAGGGAAALQDRYGRRPRRSSRHRLGGEAGKPAFIGREALARQAGGCAASPGRLGSVGIPPGYRSGGETRVSGS